LSRFISGDLLDGQATSPQTLNKYAYGLNNPISNIDITGFTAQGKNPNRTEAVNSARNLKYVRLKAQAASQSATYYEEAYVGVIDTWIDAAKVTAKGAATTVSCGIAINTAGVFAASSCGKSLIELGLVGANVAMDGNSPESYFAFFGSLIAGDKGEHYGNIVDIGFGVATVAMTGSNVLKPSSEHIAEGIEFVEGLEMAQEAFNIMFGH